MKSKEGPLGWSPLKMYALLLGMISTALVLNLVMIAGAARMYGYSQFPLGKFLIWVPFVALTVSWLTARWVRSLMDHADE